MSKLSTTKKKLPSDIVKLYETSVENPPRLASERIFQNIFEEFEYRSESLCRSKHVELVRGRGILP